MPNNLKKYDANQVLRSVFDVDRNTLRVSVVDGSTGDGSGFEVIISHTDDSIRLGDGTNFITSTTVGPKVGLDVNVINPVTIVPSGVQDVNIVSSIELEVTNDTGNPVPVTGTVNVGSIAGPVALPTGAATEAKQDVGNASLASIDAKLTAPVSVTGPLTDAQLRASPVPISAASLPLPTGAATEAKQDVGNTSLASINTNQTNGTQTTRITDGTDTASVTANANLKVADGLRQGGTQTALNLPTANTPVEAKAGASKLTNRKALIITIQNNGMFWGLTSGVTTANGHPTANGQVLSFAIDPDSTFEVWLVGNANNKNAIVSEIP